MAIDIDALVAPLHGDDPAGPDLSYDNDRTAIETAFSGGDGEEPVVWRDVASLIEQQCGITRDLALGVLWMRAAAHLGKLPLLADVSRYTAALADSNWDHMHPKLEEYGFQGRKGLCESLARIGDFIGPLKRSILIEHPRLGSYSGADLERFASEGESADGYGMFRAAVGEMDSADIDASVAALDAIRDSIKQLEKTLDDKAVDDSGPNFETTYEALRTVRSALAHYGSAPAADAVADDMPANPQDFGGSPGGRVGAVDSRDDVIRALDAICDYYRRREPGSPLPVLLLRARGLVNLDFMALLEDLIPDAVSDAERILKSRRQDDSDAGY